MSEQCIDFKVHGATIKKTLKGFCVKYCYKYIKILKYCKKFEISLERNFFRFFKCKPMFMCVDITARTAIYK